VPAGQTCPSEQRTCTNGSWSGNCANTACTVQVQATDNHIKPRGAFDGVICDAAWGWVQDEDTPDMPSDVHFYIDGQMAGSMTASANRSDLCSYLGSCNHGFTWNIPAQYKTIGQHGVTVYGIDTVDNNNNTEIAGSPKYYQCN
jgi:hypothetical protein